MTTPDPDKFLRLPSVVDRVGLQKTVIYDLVKAGDFPRPIKLGRTSVWIEREVGDWMRAKIAQTREVSA